MKVILLQDVTNTGKAHEVVNVSEGFARNFLLPKKLAMIASDKNLADIEKTKKRHEATLAAQKEEMKAAAAQISKMVFEIKSDAGESGKLFGSVTNSDVASAIKKGSGFDIDKRKVVIEEHIKTVGQYSVTVKMFHDVDAKVTIKVKASKK